LGGRDADDPMSTLMVALSHKGWHCPECLHTSTTKGNLKSHILSGRHKLFEKSHPCQYCHRSYSTRQSLQVHISTHHRFERDAEYQKDQSDGGAPGGGAANKTEDVLSTANTVPAAIATTVAPAQVAQIVYPQKAAAEVAVTGSGAVVAAAAAAAATHPHHQFVNYLSHQASMVTNAFTTAAAAAGGGGGATVATPGGVSLNYQVNEMRLPHNV